MSSPAFQVAIPPVSLNPRDPRHFPANGIFSLLCWLGVPGTLYLRQICPFHTIPEIPELGFKNFVDKRRRAIAFKKPSSCTINLYPGLPTDSYMCCHIYQYDKVLRLLPPRVRYYCRSNIGYCERVARVPLVSPAHSPRRGLGVGTEKPRPGFQQRHWAPDVCEWGGGGG